VSNECLVNAGEAYCKHVDHVCHKHCISTAISATGDELAHCQKCKKHNSNDLAAGLEHPIVATKYKKSLISNLGFTTVIQMIMLMFCCFAMLGVSLTIAIIAGKGQNSFKDECIWSNTDRPIGYLNQAGYNDCMKGAKANWDSVSGGWGGFNESISLADLPPDDLVSETAAFMIANGAQLIYSLLYLLLIYNLTLISMERDWGSFESTRQKPRCTIYKGRGFAQSYLLQLPKQVLFPLMGFSAMMHWLLGQAIVTKEWVWKNPGNKAFDIVGNVSAQYQVGQLVSLRSSDGHLPNQGSVCSLPRMADNNPHALDDIHVLVCFLVFKRRLHASDVWLYPCPMREHYRYGIQILFQRRQHMG
jgi:hypothetical protein